jgi:hypothetical protein
MAFPPGERSLTQIQTEFGGISPTGIGEYYRGGAYVPNTFINLPIPTFAAIGLGSFQGGSLRATFDSTVTTNIYNYDVAAQAKASPFYVAGASNILVTIDAGVYIGSVSPYLPSLFVSADGPSGLSPGDTVTIINNGVIQGCGGTGGNQDSGVGVTGGTAVQISRATTFANNGFLIAGGGGGGGGAVNVPFKGGSTSGGGGGGGAGFNGGEGGSSPYGPGGTGSLTAGGAGSGASGYAFGGTGGGPAAAGSPGGNTSGGGGAQTGGAGGAAGYYLIGSAFTTFTATGTRLGNVA